MSALNGIDVASLEAPPADPIACCAHAAHEAHRAFSVFVDATFIKPAWGDLSVEEQNEAKAVVYSIMRGSTPEDTHNAWFTQRSGEGWVYGPVFDRETRENPWLLPWEDLEPIFKALNTVVYHATWAMLATLNEASGAENGDAYGDPSAFAKLLGLGRIDGEG